MTNDENILGLALLLVILIVGIIAIICKVMDDRLKKKVIEHSERVNSLKKLNDSTEFIKIQSKHTNNYICYSKRELEKFSLEMYIISLISEKQKFYKSLIKGVEENRKAYDAYKKQVKEIKSTITKDFAKAIGVNYSRFVGCEEKLFKEAILSAPTMDVSICCKATYTSPMGRNNYVMEDTYNYEALKKRFAAAKKYREKQRQIEVERAERQHCIEEERAKMTVSLRYEILRRDNFRCQICGSTAQDGVKLHVDHIVPVSKGGKTTYSNLRTLCDRCNMGKSDKMEVAQSDNDI